MFPRGLAPADIFSDDDDWDTESVLGLVPHQVGDVQFIALFVLLHI